MTLRELAHSRTGDKGHLVNISVIAYDEANYQRLVRLVTAECIAERLTGLVTNVVRYELPSIGALNFVCSRGAGESVTRTLALDAHGKSFSSAILDIEIDG